MMSWLTNFGAIFCGIHIFKKGTQVGSFLQNNGHVKCDLGHGNLPSGYD